MSLSVRVWTIPKPDAASGKENEDRFYLHGLRPGTPATSAVIALTDGASDGLFARDWARTVAYSVATTPLADGSPVTDWYASVVAQSSTAWRERTQAQQGGLPWYMRARLERPTGCAWLRFALYGVGRTEHPKTWNAQAVGDVCFLHVRGDALETAFPLTRAEDFSGSPPLLLITGQEVQSPPPWEARGRWEAGDDLFLVTDALAAWFLEEQAAGRAPARWFRGVKSGADWKQRLEMLRSTNRLRGDDSTLIHLWEKL